MREHVRKIDAFQGSQLIHSCRGYFQVFIVRECPVDQLLKSGVVVKLPPREVAYGCRVLRKRVEPGGQGHIRTGIGFTDLAGRQSRAGCQ